jgi:transposase
MTSIPPPTAPAHHRSRYHLQVHVAHANDELGRPLATLQIPPPRPATSSWAGHTAWASRRRGVEGTGSDGAALARFLTANGQVVWRSTDRPPSPAPPRQLRPLDARAAAKAVQAGQVTVMPKAGTGPVEMVRCLRVARSTAIRARTQTINASRAGGPRSGRAPRAAPRPVGDPAGGGGGELEPGPSTSPLAAATLALGSLARRDQALSAEIDTLTHQLERLVATARPGCWPGRGRPRQRRRPAGGGRGQPGRLHSEAAFSMLCGASPIRRPQARPSAIASTGVVTARPTPRCTGSWSSGCAGTSRPRTL